MDEARIGVFICHCGSNIAGFLDVGELLEYASTLPHVTLVQGNMYTCADAGRAEIVKGIGEHDLNRVIVASCTPRTHEPLFRATCQQASLNPYLFEFVNIRDQCSWVHMEEPKRATSKARDLIRMGVARAALLEPQQKTRVAVVPRALVIGAGVAGLSSALSLANQGFEVKLVERKSEMGGLLRDVYQLYPTGDDARAFIKAKVEAARRHPNIEIFTGAEVRDVRGFVGNYEVVVEQGVRELSFSVGVIIVAIGAQEYKPVGMYGYDGERVITQGELEKLLAKGAEALDSSLRSVVMIQCVGARDQAHPYCSRICCMTAVKNAMLIQEANPEAQVYVLYRDMLTLGSEYEDLYREARGQGVTFIQYNPESPPTVGGGEVVVYDELLGQTLGIPCDLTVLSTPLVGQADAATLAQMLKVPVDEHGFFLEAHVKLRPLDFATDGIYLCGSAHWPSDVGESVSQAYGAAARASILLSRGEVEVEPIVSMVDEEKCIGCGLCEMVCPYSAIVLRDTEAGRKAETIVASCKGCGVCGAGCPERAISMQHFTDQQLFAQIDALLEAVALDLPIRSGVEGSVAEGALT
jgi:heterodisulfide reductase subunit A